MLTATASGLAPGTATLTITDNDSAPTAVTLSLSPNSVSEGASATSITVTAALNATASATATTVTVSRTGGTATSGSDYQAISPFTVTILANAASGTAQLSFEPTEDTAAEGDETVIFTGAASGLAPGTAALTITDNDTDTAPTAISLSLQPSSVSEGVTAAIVTVTAALSGPAPASTQVSVSVTGGTAQAGRDYRQLSAFSVTVGAGQTSGTVQVSFEPLEDSSEEGSETVTFTGSAAGLAAGTATLTITDNDRPAKTPGGGPPSVTIWTDQLVYADEQEVSLRLAVDPQGDEREYTVFFYRESIDSGERLYLAPRQRSMELRDEVVDQHGQTEGSWRVRRVERGEAELIWKGRLPHPGRWQFVAELRSPRTTQVLKQAHAKIVVPRNGSRLLARRGTQRLIETELRLSNDWAYHLGGELRVRDGGTLTIDAGAVIRASGPEAALVVEPGGRIMVRGRREAPVVLTCSAPVGQRRPGCWGGLLVQGTDTLGNGPGQQAGLAPGGRISGRISSSAGDAADAHASSGELRYLRVEFAGGGSPAGTAASAVVFEGVGARTVIDHVQAHASAGAGIAFRGGTAHCRYCVSSDARGDSVAWSMGWRGSVQHLYVQQGARGASGLRGSAASGAIAGAVPRFYNVTLVGGYNIGVPGGTPGNTRSIGSGILLEAGAGIHARNLLVTGFAGLALDGPPASFAAGASSVANAILTNSGWRRGGSSQVRVGLEPYVEYSKVNPKLLNVRYEPNPDPRPRRGSAALRLGAGAVPPYDDRFDRTADHVGAFGAKNWLEGWTFFGPESAYEVPVE